ncbi:MAG: hypothetical protein RLZZ453_718 [Chlamydiota bacterium]|jgi:hypothetical protein
MSRVTIDQLRPEDHVRWIRDQQQLSPELTRESSIVPPHSEVVGSSALYVSQLEQLFELNKCHLPFALFSPPPKAPRVNKRFFSPRLFFPAPRKSTEEIKKKETEAVGDSLYFYPQLDLHLVYGDQEGARWESRKNQDGLGQSSGVYEEQELGEEELSFVVLKEKIADFPKGKGQKAILFEKDKSALMNLMEILEWINGLLKQINAKKLQYQKG